MHTQACQRLVFLCLLCTIAIVVVVVVASSKFMKPKMAPPPSILVSLFGPQSHHITTHVLLLHFRVLLLCFRYGGESNNNTRKHNNNVRCDVCDVVWSVPKKKLINFFINIWKPLVTQTQKTTIFIFCKCFRKRKIIKIPPRLVKKVTWWLVGDLVIWGPRIGVLVT